MARFTYSPAGFDRRTAFSTALARWASVLNCSSLLGNSGYIHIHTDTSLSLIYTLPKNAEIFYVFAWHVTLFTATFNHPLPLFAVGNASPCDRAIAFLASGTPLRACERL